MWLSRIQIANVRSIRRADLELSRNINILIGPNNSGKSTIISAAYLIQRSNSIGSDDVRLNAEQGEIYVNLTDELREFFRGNQGRYEFKISKRGAIQSSGEPDARPISQSEPGNLIYPYLSKRKVVTYVESVNETNTSLITGNFQFLYSKIDKVSNPELPGNAFYRKACEDILGFRVTSVASTNGKKAAYIVDNWQYITIDKMGEGVINILGLIVDLSVAENRIFLLEEPETTFIRKL